jgi:anion-transporting  ArsA/GET3 family ATPase
MPPPPPTDSAAPALLDRRLVFVLGKGGVGRSTVAAALGLAAARSGRRSIVVEVSGRGDVPRLFGRSGSAGVETELRDGLWTLSVEPRAALEEYLRDQLPGRMIGELIGSSGAFGYVAAATPGLRELLTIGKIWELAQDRRRPEGALPYDVVVVDAPATGHGLALLEAPRTFAAAAQIGPIARQGALIAETLRDRRQTALAAVATPDRAAVDELLDMREQLDGQLDAVLVNGAMARRYDAADVAALRVALGRGAPAEPVAIALAEEERASEQRAQVARLPGPVELPLLLAAQIGPVELGELADALVALA